MTVAGMCANCKFFCQGTTTSYGECRAHAPSPADASLFAWVWPVVGVTAWCGEYQAQGS